MLKAMLSQPMGGKTQEEIVETRERAIRALRERGYEVVNTLFTDEWYGKEAMEARGVVQIPLCFLAKSLENMSLCHAAYFCKGWEQARGCRIEHEAAKAYGLEIIYEEEGGIKYVEQQDLRRSQVDCAVSAARAGHALLRAGGNLEFSLWRRGGRHDHCRRYLPWRAAGHQHRAVQERKRPAG